MRFIGNTFVFASSPFRSTFFFGDLSSFCFDLQLLSLSFLLSFFLLLFWSFSVSRIFFFVLVISPFGVLFLFSDLGVLEEAIVLRECTHPRTYRGFSPLQNLIGPIYLLLGLFTSLSKQWAFYWTGGLCLNSSRFCSYTNYNSSAPNNKNCKIMLLPFIKLFTTGFI